jgi:putative ABC transport system ATP-binding protein
VIKIHPSSFYIHPLEKTMSNIQAEKLTKTYGSGSTAVIALDHVNLTIKEGEFVAIMGPSGCGKSTLMHLLGGLDRPSEGHVLIGGHNLTDLNDDKLTELRRRKIGFIFQFFNLIPVLNAVENAALPVTLDGVKPAEAKQKATDWLTRFGLADRLVNRPDQLSGGQQQRVAIARALVAEPELILADEPTGNLDTSSGVVVMQLLSELHRSGRTVLVVTHDHRMMRFATHKIFLLDGRQVSEEEYQSASLETANMVEKYLEKYETET